MILCHSHCVYLTPCIDCIFQAHFLHATNFLYKCSVLQMFSVINFRSSLRMADSGFWKALNTTCDKLLYTWKTGRKNIKKFECVLLWRARLLEEKDDMFTICFHHKELFGKVFAGETDKCYSILKSHCCNDKAHIVFNLEMAKILKEKGFNDVLLCQKFIQAMCNRVWKVN